MIIQHLKKQITLKQLDKLWVGYLVYPLFLYKEEKMLTLTRKKYEIEEEIKINDEDGKNIIDFKMQITPEEKLEIRGLIFDEQDVKDGRKLSKLEKEGKVDEYVELEAKVLERAKKRQDKFEEIIFKDRKNEIKKTAGESIYLDLVDMLFDFFVKTFAEKKSAQINTLTTHLRKISNN